MGKEATQMSHCCPGAALLGVAQLCFKVYHVISTEDNGVVGWS